MTDLDWDEKPGKLVGWSDELWEAYLAQERRTFELVVSAPRRSNQDIVRELSPRFTPKAV